MKKVSIVASLVLCSTLSFAFDLNSITKSVMDNVAKPASSSSNTSTTKTGMADSTVSSGLKEALKVGTEYAVKSLGSNNGYLNNSLVKIPLPGSLQKVEGLIRSAGGDKIADDLINSMNTAATKAAPQTAEIFVDAIDKMSLTDAQKILSGGENAATDYFKTNTNTSLKQMIAPIIQGTMKENQVAGYYDTFNKYYKEYGKGVVDNSAVSGLAKSFGVDSYLPGGSDQSRPACNRPKNG